MTSGSSMLSNGGRRDHGSEEVQAVAHSTSVDVAQQPEATDIKSGYSVASPSLHDRKADDNAPGDAKNAIEPIEIEEQDEHFANGKVHELTAPATADDVITNAIHLHDDPSLPAVTFRSMFLGVGLSVFGGVLSGIYYFKPQTIVLPAVFLAVMAFLLGETMSLIIPRKGRIGRFLNPCPFNIKEHLAITIMANSASISALGIEIIAVERLYYDKTLNGAISVFLLLSSQFMGYGIAGLMRRTMVYPKAMLWPANIPIISMLENLHLRLPEGRKPLRVFLLVFAAIFIWELFPQWIMPVLTGISVFCLASRKSQVFTNIFGGAQGNEGLGLFSICLDWQYISGGYSPLYFPISSLISQGIGVCGCIILFAGVYYSNVWDATRYPFLSQLIFSDTSTVEHVVQYNQSLAIGPNNKINMTAVDNLGLPAFSASNVLNLLLTNMCIAAALVHLFLWYRDEVKVAFSFLDPRTLYRSIRDLPVTVRRAFAPGTRANDDEWKDHYDPHYAFMRSYKQCPDWWYGIVLILSLVVGLIVIYQADSTLPWWGFFIASLVGYVLIVLLGSMQGITGVPFTIQSIVQMIGGYIQPGNPVANMYFSLYGYNALLQGNLLAQDLKLAQYGHLAPRVTFFVQMLGTLIGVVFNYIMANSIVTNQFEILRSVEGTNIWSGNQAQQFNAQAVTFGGLPHQLFSVGARYEWVPLSMFFGFLAPIPFWLAHRKWPKLGLNYVNTPVIMFYLCYLNVGINSSLMMFFIVGFTSQWFIRKRYPNLFVRYNYLVSAALDGGTSVMVFILSFAVLGAAGAAVAFPSYWGNNSSGNIDYCYQAPSS
ncbi:hypothetical protein AC578_6407 [Pseudocercospora eumusae]|uniref:OPT family small oligopeptide transporter n=1 Tax=Pseudocercospora eumusae TaxID=321146 RepID=A0A139H6Z0_9PEZI|nr:hypothetical protein AC578_6407 [Pseudocercospora eumusae]